MGQKLSVFITEQDIYNNTHLFKTHREYINHRFNQEFGMEVTQYSHKYDSLGNKLITGLVYERTDSIIMHTLKVTGEVGVSLRRMDAEGNKVQK